MHLARAFRNDSFGQLTRVGTQYLTVGVQATVHLSGRQAVPRALKHTTLLSCEASVSQIFAACPHVRSNRQYFGHFYYSPCAMAAGRLCTSTCNAVVPDPAGNSYIPCVRQSTTEILVCPHTSSSPSRLRPNNTSK